MLNLRLRGVPRPLTQLHMKPLTLRGNSERGKEEVWETSSSFPLLFFSRPPHALSILMLSVFVFFFFCVFFARITFFHIYTRLPAVLFASPRSLCCCCPPPTPPRSSMFEVIRPGLHVPLSLPPSELCLLTISCFLSASSPSSCSFATKMAAFHDPLAVTWLSSRSGMSGSSETRRISS